MREPDREGAAVRLDFRGLAAAVQHTVKPDFADVLRRAGRRRAAARSAAAAFVTVGVAAGGTAILASTGDGTPRPTVTPSPTPGVWRIDPGPGRPPAPQPSYTQIAPDAWDVTEPDVPLTGMFTELVAGDLDHLYLEYQDCVGRVCTRMVAASADRGRTWHKRRMPDVLANTGGWSILAVHGETIVARDNRRREWPKATKPIPRFDPTAPFPANAYRTSVDGGVTWRQPAIRTVEALPAGWAVFWPRETGTVAAVDPTTGDIARVLPAALRGEYVELLRTPSAAGIWLAVWSQGGLAMVSHDGGRTWEERRLPKGGLGTGSGSADARLATVDGRTVYAIRKRGDSVQVIVSTDGGRTWRERALVDLDGPLLSLLPTADGAVLIEGPTGTFRSTDAGRTFARVGPSLGARARVIPGGYAIPTNNNEYGVWLSPDGANWSYVSRPDVP
jgi:hypothetical protein